MPAAKPEVQEQAIRLRVEERLSFREIQARVNVSKGSLSAWLRPYPLTKEEQAQRLPKDRSVFRTNFPWSTDQTSRLYAVMPEGLSTLQKAKISEAAVLLRCVVRGWNVYGSPFDGDSADWIVEDKEHGIKRVQVRTCYRNARGGSPLISLTTTAGGLPHRRLPTGHFDFLVGYDLQTDTAFVYSEAEVAHLRKTISVTQDAVEAFHKFPFHCGVEQPGSSRAS